MENIKNTLNDEAYEFINNITTKDREISSKTSEDIFKILKKELSENKEYELKNAFLTVSQLLSGLTQVLCKSEKEFNFEAENANRIMLDKLIPAILNDETSDGKEFDPEDLSMKRIMLSIACVIDYIFYRLEFAEYQKVREQLEKIENSEGEGDK